MREDALSVAELNDPNLKVTSRDPEPLRTSPNDRSCVPAAVYDVGGGTGFNTLGVVKTGVKPENVTLLDQSPHQLAKARAKPALK
eukprot:4673259-Pyramimonas_sp.AAC.1